MLRIKWRSDTSWKTKIRKFVRKPNKILSHLYLGFRMGLWDKQREQVVEESLWSLTAHDDVHFNPNVIELPGEKFNNEKNAELIRSIAPDVMIVCGGPILRESIFNIPRLGTINIHFGVSPFYRGNHTILWPFFHNDFEKIGATIHQIDRGVDTGEVFARIYPDIQPGDGEFAVEVKIAKLVTETMTDLLSFVQENPSKTRLSGIQFQEKGLEIRTKDLTLFVDAKYQLRKLLGLCKVPRLSERRELFFLQSREPARVAD